MDEKKRVTKAAGLMTSGTLVSRVLGFVRDVVLAKVFGATGLTDSFFVAYRIPNLLRELFAEGSVSAGFVPVFTEYLTEKGREEAKRLAGTVFAFLLCVLSAVCLLGILLAPYIASIVARGFMSEPEKFSLTITMIRIMFPFLLFISLAALAMGTLNSLRCFFIPSIAPAFFNIAIIVAALFIAPHFTVPIIVVGFAVTAGGAFQYGVQALALVRKRFHLRPIFDFYHPGLKRILLLVMPVVFAMGVTQINVLISNFFSTYLPEGSATYLYYSWRLTHFPIGLFAIAMSVALLPSLSAQATKGDIPALRDTFSFSLRVLFFITIPSMVGLIALSRPIVNILFQRGAFDVDDAGGTVYALLFYASGIWAFAGLRIVRTVFYSLQDTKTPLKTAVLSVIANIVFCLLLMKPFRHGGLAFANVLAASINFIVLFYLLRIKIKRVDGTKILASFVKTMFASAVMGFAGWLATRSVLWRQPGYIYEKSFTLVSVMILCIFIYIVIMYVLKSEELSYIFKMIRKK
jgi:putative peptidoglycan lipid II flippase